MTTPSDPEERFAVAALREVVREVVREEVARLYEQGQTDAAAAGRAAAALYAASLALYLAAVFLSLMAVYILGALIEPWVGALVVGGALLAGALLALARARRYAARQLARDPPRAGMDPRP